MPQLDDDLGLDGEKENMDSKIEGGLDDVDNLDLVLPDILFW
jgi:hypothetical protein